MSATTLGLIVLALLSYWFGPIWLVQLALLTGTLAVATLFWIALTSKKQVPVVHKVTAHQQFVIDELERFGHK